jgi:hypothetical protein
MIPRTRPARVAAAVGVTVAAGAAAMLAVTTTASADEPGRCLQNVNVREDPDAESRIVALCEAGTRVKLGEERDGFVRIDEMGGWVAEDYVKADESSSGDHSSSSGSSDDRSEDRSDDRDGSDEHGSGDGERRSSDDEHRSGSAGASTGAEDSSDEATSGSDTQLEDLLS